MGPREFQVHTRSKLRHAQQQGVPRDSRYSSRWRHTACIGRKTRHLFVEVHFDTHMDKMFLMGASFVMYCTRLIENGR